MISQYLYVMSLRKATNMLTFQPELSMGDLLTFCALLIASTGLFFNFFQMRRAYKQRSAEYIITLYNHFVSDEDMMSIYYKIEYGNFEFNENFQGSKEEKQLDKVLGHFENLARLYELKNITYEDLKVAAYEFVVVYQDKSVRAYLQFLDDWCNSRGIKDRPYRVFEKVGRMLEREVSHRSGQ